MNTLSRHLLHLLLAVLVVATTLSPAVAASVESSYNKARKAYFELIESPKKQKYRDQWLKVRDLFLRVTTLDAAHQRSADALYMAGKVSQELYDVSYVKGDLHDAITFFDRLALEHPGSSLADDGLMISAEIFEGPLADKQAAIERYSRVVSIYHDGDMHESAGERLRSLAPERIPAPPRQVPEPVTGEGVITDIRYHTYPEFTRVVLDLDAPVEAKPGFVKGDSPRIFIDISPGKLGALSQPVALEDGRIEKVRVGQFRDDVTRVVLDLSSSQPYQVFTLSDPFRVIVDVTGPKAEPAQQDDSSPLTAAAPVVKASPAKEVVAADDEDGVMDEEGLATVITTRPEADENNVAVPESTRGRKIRIVVDPGHGGKDPGAIGPRGVMEKDVTLALAKSLATELKKSFPCEVILTRDRDVFIPLDERTLIANRLDADLFVSLHANANRSRTPYGVETYYLNFSKNDDVIEVVARENGTSLQKVGDLDMILLDLMANSKINESSRLAAEIQGALVDGLSRKYSYIKDLGVRQGPFHVLWNATMPSVLVEVAFISNRREEKRLVDRDFQKHSAVAISQGVGKYLEAYNLAAN